MANRTFTRIPAAFLLAISCVTADGFAFAQQKPSDKTDVNSFAEQTFNSEAFKGYVSSYQQQNSAVINSITSSAVSKAQGALPKVMEYGSRLRYGEHNVVTNDGETIVSWMIQLTGADANRRKEFLSKLAELAARRNPEALTFSGFVAEYGLFGEPKNLQRALSLYRSAAEQNYQPAIYNLALAAAYGKGQAVDPASAAALIDKAAAIATDGSFRVCGFGAFLSYRRGDSERSARYSRNCFSALANIPKALYDERTTAPQRIGLLRESIATGIDDGYALLERVSHEAGPDPQYTSCKYKLLNCYRNMPRKDGLLDEAKKCYQQSAPVGTDPREVAQRMSSAVQGIAGFVPSELSALQKLRAGNRFHYAWSVPYLPFRQQDVDAFLPFVAHTKQ